MSCYLTSHCLSTTVPTSSNISIPPGVPIKDNTKKQKEGVVQKAAVLRWRACSPGTQDAIVESDLLELKDHDKAVARQKAAVAERRENARRDRARQREETVAGEERAKRAKRIQEAKDLLEDVHDDEAGSSANHADKGMCVVCLSAPSRYLIRTCGHQCLCAKCNTISMNVCPVCRTPYAKKDVIRVYVV